MHEDVTAVWIFGNSRAPQPTFVLGPKSSDNRYRQRESFLVNVWNLKVNLHRTHISTLPIFDFSCESSFLLEIENIKKRLEYVT